MTAFPSGPRPCAPEWAMDRSLRVPPAPVSLSAALDTRRTATINVAPTPLNAVPHNRIATVGSRKHHRGRLAYCGDLRYDVAMALRGGLVFLRTVDLVVVRMVKGTRSMPGRMLGYAAGLTILLVAASAIGAPPNDDCANAIAVPPGATPFTTVEATTDGPVDCGVESDIWYRITSPCSGRLAVSLCDSDYDTVLALYAGSACPPDPFLNCDDDGCGLASTTTIASVAGEEYLIRIGGFGGETGAGTMNVQCIAPLTNDN